MVNVVDIEDAYKTYALRDAAATTKDLLKWWDRGHRSMPWRREFAFRCRAEEGERGHLHRPTRTFAFKPGEVTAVPANAKKFVDTVVLPVGTPAVPTNCCFGMEDLQYVFGLESVVVVGSGAFINCSHVHMTLPSGLQSVHTRAFSLCERLALPALPPALTFMGDRAFANCPELTATSLPPGLKTINAGTFSNCTKLALLTLPPDLERVQANAFVGCKELNLTHWPSKLTHIGPGAFYGCAKLATRYIPDTVKEIASTSFHQCPMMGPAWREWRARKRRRAAAAAAPA